MLCCFVLLGFIVKEMALACQKSTTTTTINTTTTNTGSGIKSESRKVGQRSHLITCARDSSSPGLLVEFQCQ